MKTLLITIILFVASSSGVMSTETQNCLSYEPATVTLIGRVVLRDSFGPPGYGEDPDRDEKRRNIVLLLASPICVTGGYWDKEPEYDVREVQIALASTADKQYKSVREYVGTPKLFYVHGHLYHRHTGYHITEVLLFTDEIGLRESAPTTAIEGTKRKR
jgi:hypothetical protein